MHFITFPVASTNIFPLSNSTRGGQLVTEYNLKSRDMVTTNPEIKYAVGPSFIHSMDDFKVSLLEDSDVAEFDKTATYDVGDYCTYNNNTYLCLVAVTTPGPFDPDSWKETTISHSILQIAPGRAVINGHFVETLAPMQVDLRLANIELRRSSKPELFGNLSIGIKSYFSTENTMSGSMLVENTDNMYIGIQLVIEKRDEFKTPDDCPSNQADVTADLKLADFTYANGVISAASIAPNENALRYIPSTRIRDFDALLDEKYVSVENLVDDIFYTYAGYGKWCNSVDSLMVWDSHPAQGTTPPAVGQAQFYTDSNGDVSLIIPHKQIDADIVNDNDQKVYYQDRVLEFPTANYDQGTSGIVTSAYTQNIKDIAAVINTYKQFTNGKQVGFLDQLTVNDEGEYSYELPKNLSSSNFNVGDYIIVREDFTVSVPEDNGAPPSTMYVVLPGGVTSIEWVGQEQPSGIRLGNQVLWEGDGINPPTPSNPSAEELLEDFNYTTYRGVVGEDYFELLWHNSSDTETQSYYYKVSASGPMTWSDAVLLTGGVPLATEEQAGGFYNASTDAAYEDAGYVYLDDTGHLKLVDYALLRTGALAYQLGKDFSVPANNTLDYIQEYLDESVNARVAFKTNATLSTTPTMINVIVPLPADEEGTLNIYNIDSRFGTGVYLHFTVDDKTAEYSNIVINIIDCEKVRIDSSITTLSSGPMINVLRSCLYYDASVINYISECDIYNKREELFTTYTTNKFTGFDNLSLWYNRFTISDPDIVVNGLEISQPNEKVITEDITFWNETISGDNHYSYALRSITLSSSGVVIGCSLYVGDDSTHQVVTEVNATTHTVIGGKFKIPQGPALKYPEACIKYPISVTGTFTTAYMATNGVDWIVTDTDFSAKSGIYISGEGVANGSIAFNSSTYFVPAAYTNVTTLDAWGVNEFHIFYGGTTQ